MYKVDKVLYQACICSNISTKYLDLKFLENIGLEITGQSNVINSIFLISELSIMPRIYIFRNKKMYSIDTAHILHHVN